ncbi:hypothetical protein niasHT_038547 [Heterodera trifolii]|uniref:BTB domain-containing protein n=1 Tax=Heterodera trifolii TaxID=157864 RepID=A0ABD2HYN9_9BILA
MSTKPNLLVDRMKLLLSTGNGADVHFAFGEGDQQQQKELLPAHKTILMAASDVFETMFRFDAQNAAAKHNPNGKGRKKIRFNWNFNWNGRKKRQSKTVEVPSPILITDIDADAFKAMLGFIYADDLSALNRDNVISVLYAARKYNIPALVNACSDFPVTKLRNVFLSFGQAHSIREEAFALRCLLYIDQNADKLFKSDGFVQIDQKTLCELLDREQLMIKDEISLWHTAIRWADAQCRQNGHECSGENRRAALGPALYKIRFPLIPEEQFTDQIVPTGVLTGDEVARVFDHFRAEKNRAQPEADVQYPLQFAAQRRSPYVDPNKTNGTFILKIEKLSEFAQAKNGTKRSSEIMFIRGIPWQIMAIKEADDELYFYIQCSDDKTDSKWKCPYSVTYQIDAQNKGNEHFVFGTGGHIGTNFECRSCRHRRGFWYLMSEHNDWYNRAEDTLTLRADVLIGEPYKDTKN